MAKKRSFKRGNSSRNKLNVSGKARGGAKGARGKRVKAVAAAAAQSARADAEASGETNGIVIPKSMVFRRGDVTPSVVQLVRDLRLVMSPNTSSRLKERKSNSLKDFLSVGPMLGVTHFQVFSQTDLGVNMRIVRVPHGPTLTFRVTAYSLMRDIAKIQKRPHSPASECEYAPLVVLNNFSATPVVIDPLQDRSDDGDGHTTAGSSSSNANATFNTVHPPSAEHIKLLATVLRNMYPPLSIPTLKLPQCRRVVLYHFDPVSHLVDMRHYLIRASPANINRAVKKLLKARIPNLGHLTDVSEYMQNQMALSDSEGEELPESRVTLADRYVGRGNFRNQQSAVRLQELGPRMTLSLMKIEEEFFTGRVLYHHYVKKTKEEEEMMQQLKRERERVREQRRKEQEENVRRKRRERGEDSDGEDGYDADDADGEDDEEVGRSKRRVRIRETNQQQQEYDPDMHSDAEESSTSRRSASSSSNSSSANASKKRKRDDSSSSTTTDEFDAGTAVLDDAEQEDDDAKWYEMEVGEKPDPSLFAKSQHRHRSTSMPDGKRFKRHKGSDRRGDAEEQEGDGDASRSAPKKNGRGGGRRVGAGPRKPWVRGRGGKHAGEERGGGGNGRGRSNSRGGSRGGRGGSRGGRGRGSR